MRIATSSILALALVTVACGGGDDVEVVCTEGSTTPECLPADFTVETQGMTTPPRLDDLLATETAAETMFLASTGAAQTQSMANGFRIDLAAGALAAGTTVTVDRYEEELEAPAYRIAATAAPSAAVSLTFPLPGDLTDVAPGEVFVLAMHGPDDVEALTGEIDAIEGTITVQTTRFSVFAAIDQRGAAPITGDKITKVPFYDQGDSDNCWSMALTMLMTAYGVNVEPWQNNAFFQMSAEHGLTFWQFQWYPGLARHIKALVPGATVERKSWFTTVTDYPVRTYLEQNMRLGRPTMVHWYTPAHMVLFVGLEGDKFVVHNPNTGGYVRMTWAELTPHFATETFDGTGTLALGVPASDSSWNATILVPHATTRGTGIDFQAPAPDGTFDLRTAQIFMWYLDALMGPGLMSFRTKGPGVLTDKHHLFAKVQIANIIDKSPARPFSAGFELLDSGGSAVYTLPPISVSVAGGVSVDVPLIDKDRGVPITDLIEENGAYTARLWVGEGSTRMDTISFPFVVDQIVEPTECEELTTDFRDDCPSGSDCFCIGNAFCEGEEEVAETLTCGQAEEDCALHCLIFDDGTCDCARYCEMFLGRMGCSGGGG